MNKLFVVTILIIGCTIASGRFLDVGNSNDGMVGGMVKATEDEVNYVKKVLNENMHLIRNENAKPNPLK